MRRNDGWLKRTGIVMMILAGLFLCGCDGSDVSTPETPEQPTEIPKFALEDTITMDALLGHVQTLENISLAQEMSRSTASPGYVQSVDYFKNVLSNSGLAVSDQEFEYRFFMETELPTMEMTKYSIRSEGTDYEQATGWTYEAPDLMLFLRPYHYGDPGRADYSRGGTIFWENCAYAGLVPLLFMLIVSVFGFKNSYVKFFLVSSIVVLFTVMTKNKILPLFRIFWTIIPGFKMFRFPHRLLLFVEVGIAVFTGFGIDLLRKKIRGHKFNVLYFIIVALIIFDLFKCGHVFSSKA